MIPAQELRLNNLVVFSETKEIQVVQGFHLNEVQTNDIGRSGGDHDFTIDDIEPIELTPEILIKCGFESYKETTDDAIGEEIEYWKIYPIDVFFDINDELVLKNYHVNINRPKHLHQLQNLFFSLTGEELNYIP